MRKLENRITDYFVICHGSSRTQVDSISDSVEDTVRKEAGEKPLHVEGLENCFWVLVRLWRCDSSYFPGRIQKFLQS